jgi:hypothetical protein
MGHKETKEEIMFQSPNRLQETYYKKKGKGNLKKQ